MKKNTCWIIILLITGCFFGNLRTSSTGKNYLLPTKDSVTIDTRLKALTIKESALKSKIEAEDKKRNASYKRRFTRNDGELTRPTRLYLPRPTFPTNKCSDRTK